MGPRPTLGHMPDTYSLLSDPEPIQECEAYLMPRLDLSGETIKPQVSTQEELGRENAKLKGQLLRLTKLITQRA